MPILSVMRIICPTSQALFQAFGPFSWSPLPLCQFPLCPQFAPIPVLLGPLMLESHKLEFVFCQVELFSCRHWQRQLSCWHYQWTVHVLVNERHSSSDVLLFQWTSIACNPQDGLILKRRVSLSPCIVSPLLHLFWKHTILLEVNKILRWVPRHHHPWTCQEPFYSFPEYLKNGFVENSMCQIFPEHLLWRLCKNLPFLLHTLVNLYQSSEVYSRLRT